MAFARDDVEGLSALLDEPGWVRERRLEAWGFFEKMELPKEKEEPWRYTDLQRLKFGFGPFTPVVPARQAELTAEQKELVSEEGARAGYIIHEDAGLVMRELDQDLGSRGVVLEDLATATKDHSDLVQEHLFSEARLDESVFSALHGALFSGGTFLYVPAGVTVHLPIESQRWIRRAGAAVFPHALIVAGEGAELVYIERLRSPELDSPSLCVGATQIVAGPGARVRVVSVQEYSQQVWHFQTQSAISARDVNLHSLVVTLGGRFSRTVVESIIRGERSFSEMLGLYFAEHGQHFDHRTLQDHVAGSSSSDLLYKGALKDTSRTVYSGLIRVNPGAAGTDAYQANRNLVLSDDAKADSKPELEILNNDVRCTHGSTVGQIDEEELFYLRSRGIPPKEAERLVVIGFFEEVLARVGIPEFRAVLRDAIERRLGR